ncbi:MAG: RNA polymerase-binding transcription factor DksA [Myxococcota bacterium]|nr:RNA polymerase-binding transcription factor DksA [Myxococcota bacterium]
MTKKQLAELRKILEDERDRLLQRSRDAFTTGVDRFVEGGGRDELDEASEDGLKDQEIRLQNRERTLLKKITVALQRMQANEYELCESCGDEIGYARLKARPVATLCIKCKEEQEQDERQTVEDVEVFAPSKF